MIGFSTAWDFITLFQDVIDVTMDSPNGRDCTECPLPTYPIGLGETGLGSELRWIFPIASLIIAQYQQIRLGSPVS